jgi:hypothetical protein
MEPHPRQGISCGKVITFSRLIESGPHGSTLAFVFSNKAWKAMSDPAFLPGQKVRTPFGDIRTVREQIGHQVFVKEADINAWYDFSQLQLVTGSKDTSRQPRRR